MINDVLSRAVHAVFEIPSLKDPTSAAAWQIGNVEYEITEALKNNLSYTDALRVAVALNDHYERVKREVKLRNENLAAVDTTRCTDWLYRRQE